MKNLGERSSKVEPPNTIRKDGGSIPTRSLQFFVREISHQEAAPFIIKHHYSKLVPSGRNIYFGGFICEKLYCVASYGSPKGNMVKKKGTNPYVKFLRKTTGLKIVAAKLYELSRLCRVGTKQDKKIPLTQFLAHCHRILKKQYRIQFIVSFCDTELWGFSGTIYKAANFTYLGKTNEIYHTIPRQYAHQNIRKNRRHIVHRRVAYRAMKNWNATHSLKERMTLDQMRKKMKLIPIKTPAKDRWFLDLGA